jgi:hypothetical protein
MSREIKFRAWDDKAMVENYASTGPYGEMRWRQNDNKRTWQNRKHQSGLWRIFHL